MDSYIQLIHSPEFKGPNKTDTQQWLGDARSMFDTLTIIEQSKHLVRQFLAVSYLSFTYDGEPDLLITKYAIELDKLYESFKRSRIEGEMDRIIFTKACQLVDNLKEGRVIQEEDLTYYFSEEPESRILPSVGAVGHYLPYLAFKKSISWNQTSTEKFTTEDNIGFVVPYLSTRSIQLGTRTAVSYQYSSEGFHSFKKNFFHYFSGFDFGPIPFKALVGTIAAHTVSLDNNSIRGHQGRIFYNLYKVIFDWIPPVGGKALNVSGSHILPFLDMLVVFRRKNNIVLDRVLLELMLEGSDIRELARMGHVSEVLGNEKFKDSIFGEFKEIQSSTEADEDEELDEDPDDFGEEEPEDDPDIDPEDDEGDDETDPDEDEEGTEPEEVEEEPTEPEYTYDDKTGVEFVLDESDASFSGVMFRREVRGIINSIVGNPPEHMSTKDVNILKILKTYWLNLLDGSTILTILKMVKAPVAIKQTKKE